MATVDELVGNMEDFLMLLDDVSLLELEMAVQIEKIKRAWKARKWYWDKMVKEWKKVDDTVVKVWRDC